MKFLVCVSHVPDTITKIKYTPDGKGLDKTGVTYIINPYDEFGLVRAIEHKEQSGAGQVTVLTVGSAEVEPTLRKALAIGADDAVRIDTNPEDGFSVAKQIAEYARGKGFDVIMFGKESIDHNGSEVPGMVAEILELPFISQATRFEVNGTTGKLNREVNGGYEIVETTFPAVISCQKGMAEWRIPNMRGIMAARTKPLAVVAPVSVVAAITTVNLSLPPEKGGCTYIPADQPEKLADLLHEKGLI